MPTRDTTPPGAPCWIDLSSSDPAGSRAFYGALLGWTATEPDEQFGGYAQFLREGAPVAGVMATGPGGVPDVWTVYLASQDADKTVAAATAAGASALVPPMPVADLGTMAVLAGPDGAVVGVWQAGTFDGFGVLAEAGAPSWFELHTRDYERAVGFYRDVFGWDTEVASDAPEFRYTTLGRGADQAAGVMDSTAFLPEGTPAHWTVYFGVADADATVARVGELGGTVVTPPEDTPYGRLATVTDPSGAVFRLIAPNAAMPGR